MNSGVKPQKQTVFIAKSTNKQFLLTNSGVIASILGVPGLELHSNGTESVNFFWAQSSLGGHNSRLGGSSSGLGGGGTAPKCPPVASVLKPPFYATFAYQVKIKTARFLFILKLTALSKIYLGWQTNILGGRSICPLLPPCYVPGARVFCQLFRFCRKTPNFEDFSPSPDLNKKSPDITI